MPTRAGKRADSRRRTCRLARRLCGTPGQTAAAVEGGAVAGDDRGDDVRVGAQRCGHDVRARVGQTGVEHPRREQPRGDRDPPFAGRAQPGDDRVHAGCGRRDEPDPDPASDLRREHPPGRPHLRERRRVRGARRGEHHRVAVGPARLREPRPCGAGQQRVGADRRGHREPVRRDAARGELGGQVRADVVAGREERGDDHRPVQARDGVGHLRAPDVDVAQPHVDSRQRGTHGVDDRPPRRRARRRPGCRVPRAPAVRSHRPSDHGTRSPRGVHQLTLTAERRGPVVTTRRRAGSARPPAPGPPPGPAPGGSPA